jgi:hypothetical protein
MQSDDADHAESNNDILLVTDAVTTLIWHHKAASENGYLHPLLLDIYLNLAHYELADKTQSFSQSKGVSKSLQKIAIVLPAWQDEW